MKKVYCTHCGHEIPKNANYCFQCGEKTFSDMIYCMFCRNRISKNSNFCYYCGNGLYHTQTSEIRYCIFCGSVLPKEANFCSSCGEENFENQNSKEIIFDPDNEEEYQKNFADEIFEEIQEEEEILEQAEEEIEQELKAENLNNDYPKSTEQAFFRLIRPSAETTYLAGIENDSETYLKTEIIFSESVSEQSNPLFYIKNNIAPYTVSNYANLNSEGFGNTKPKMSDFQSKDYQIITKISYQKDQQTEVTEELEFLKNAAAYSYYDTGIHDHTEAVDLKKRSDTGKIYFAIYDYEQEFSKIYFRTSKDPEHTIDTGIVFDGYVLKLIYADGWIFATVLKPKELSKNTYISEPNLYAVAINRPNQIFIKNNFESIRSICLQKEENHPDNNQTFFILDSKYNFWEIKIMGENFEYAKLLYSLDDILNEHHLNNKEEILKKLYITYFNHYKIYARVQYHQYDFMMSSSFLLKELDSELNNLQELSLLND